MASVVSESIHAEGKSETQRGPFTNIDPLVGSISKVGAVSTVDKETLPSQLRDGKCGTYVLSYLTIIPPSKLSSQCVRFIFLCFDVKPCILKEDEDPDCII